jgi:O-antigen ligase
LLVPPALVVALALDQGGFDPSAWVWSGTLAAWAAATAAVVSRDLRLARTARAWLASGGLVLAWVALSWLWSDRRAQTVLEIRRTAVYAAVVLALIALARRGAERQLVLSTHVAISAVVVYAVARYLTETRTPDTFEGTLLAQPLGYANALGALAAIGVVLGIGLAAHAPPGRERAFAAATVPILAAALPLTQSRGAAVALCIGLVTTVACADDAAPLVRALLLATPGSAIAVIAAATSRLSDDNAKQPYAHVALVVGAVAIVSAAGTAVAAARAQRIPRLHRHVPRPALAAALGIGLVAAGAASGSTEPRTSLWGVAWHQFERHPADGSGVGTFALAWARSGLIETRGGALDAHSLYLETLAELGLVGLALLLAFLAVPLLHARRAPVAAGAYVVFLVHAGLDWDWEMPAVVVAGLCCGAAALAFDADQPRPVTPRGRAAVVVLAIALGALSIAGARSSSEPGVSPPPRSVAVVLPVAVPVALPVLLLRSGLGRAGRERVAMAKVRLDGLRRDGDQVPRMLLRVGAVADLHAVLLARRSVLTARRAVLTARRAVLAS